MRGTITAIALMLATAAHAQTYRTDTTRSSREVITVPACTESFPDLPKIAERLSVRPTNGHSGAIVLTMCDGRKYDFLALVNALLDRMDKSGK